jgi:hypothetical protein
MSSAWTPWVGGLAAEVPPNWLFKESLTLLAPEGQANIIFSSEPLGEGMTAREYAEAQQDLLRKEFPGWEPRGGLEAFPITGLDEVGWTRDFTWEPPGRERVRQVQIYGVQGARGWTATATADPDVFLQLEGDLLSALERLSVRQGRSQAAE